MRRYSRAECNVIRKQLMVQQNYCCALCGIKFGGKIIACLDHDHKTGMIRAALCQNCNGIEGRILHYARRATRKGMDIERTVEQVLLDIVNYWKYHAENPSGMIHHQHKG